MQTETKTPFYKRREYWPPALLLLAVGALYVYLMRPDVAGYLYDDGMYLMAARSILDGHGYRLPDMLGEPTFYKYPPLFPLLMAIGWFINPQFPENIPFLKCINIAVALLALAGFFHYFRNVRRQPMAISLGLIAVIATNMRLIEVSNELMSEPLFLLASVLLILVAEKIKDRTDLDLKRTARMALLSAAAFYARTMALPLIVATSLWLYLKAGFKKAALYAGLSGLAVLPWFLWTALRPDQTYALHDFLVRTFQETYFQSFRMDLRYEYNPLELYATGVQKLVGNLSLHLFPLMERLMLFKKSVGIEAFILAVSFVFFLMLCRRLYDSVKARTFSPAGLYVCVYLLILPFWSYHNMYPRFIIVILPFILEMIVSAMRAVNAPTLRNALVSGFLAIAFASNIWHLSPFLAKPYRNTMLIFTKADFWTDAKAAVDAIRRHTPEDAVLYAVNDNTYFYALNTGRKTTDFFIFLPKKLLMDAQGEISMANIREWLDRRASVNLELLKKHRVNYVIEHRFVIVKNQYNNWTSAQILETDIKRMRDEFPQAFEPVFLSPHEWIVIYKFHPEVYPDIKGG